MNYELHHGDCLDVLRGMADNSVDSVVTDPPYGLSFMGRKWDYDVPSVEIWAECLRVLKPGGHLLAFAGTRTQHRMACRIEDGGFEIRDMLAWLYGSGFPKHGNALKPALEPITMARKPLVSTVEANWREHGTGALNIDGCRVGDFQNTTPSGVDRRNASLAEAGYRPGAYQMGEKTPETPPGRWPANLLHDGSVEVVALFPAKAGASAPVRGDEASKASVGNVTGERNRVPGAFHADAGSAARFFYCAKASRKDRSEGNTHPTVKPTDLMRYLCRLVTPPGGVVLDPFMGSGSTGKAAKLEGFDFIGIERETEYIAIARARIGAVRQQLFGGTP